MKRADKKKNDFKKKVTNFYNEYRYFFIALGLIFITASFGIVWNLFDRAATVDFDLNNVIEEKVGEYSAELVEYGEGKDFVVAEGELEDVDLIRLQRAVREHLGTDSSIYLVDEALKLSEPVHYIPGLLKRVEWSMLEEKEHHEIITFQILSSVKPDVTRVPEWDIRSEDSHFDEDLYVVKGKISEFATTVDKLAQMSGLADMVYDINEENNETELNDILLHFESGDNDLYYHTRHKGVIGESLYYSINNNSSATENDS